MVVQSAPMEALELILARLDPKQRAATTFPDGPAQIIAPAGSGKTTTMVARLAVLVARWVPAGRHGVDSGPILQPVRVMA